jgi:hypothetical protein
MTNDNDTCVTARQVGFQYNGDGFWFLWSKAGEPKFTIRLTRSEAYQFVNDNDGLETALVDAMSNVDFTFYNVQVRKAWL